jgi:hypothetical protein
VIWKWAVWGVLIIVQNASFTLVSRSRNTDHWKYHAVAIIFGNTIYFFSGLFNLDNALKILQTRNLPLILGTVVFVTSMNLIGGLSSQRLAIRIERWLKVRP